MATLLIYGGSPVLGGYTSHMNHANVLRGHQSCTNSPTLISSRAYKSIKIVTVCDNYRNRDKIPKMELRPVQVSASEVGSFLMKHQLMKNKTLIHEGKANFDMIYNQPDPRAYYTTLGPHGPLDYKIPELAWPIFESVIKSSGQQTILDVCCSYGINSMLLRYGIHLSEYASRCGDAIELPPTAFINADKKFFANRSWHLDIRMLGLDVVQPAIDYAITTRLLDDGWAENLEKGDPSPQLGAGIRNVGMIISTGGVGYVGRPTFERLMKAIKRPKDLWAIVFVLRVFDYSDIIALFNEYGLVTEQIKGVTFRQRRFIDPAEYEVANHDVILRGLDPSGKEADGWYHANCFITRPASEANRVSLDTLLVGSIPNIL